MSSGSSWAKPAGQRSRLFADRQPLLRPWDRLVAGRQRLAQRGDVLRDLFEALQDLIVLAAGGGAGHALDPLLDAVECVLDRLEALRNRAQTAGQAFDIRRGWDVEGSHCHVLRRDRLLPRLECALERPGDKWVPGQLFSELSESFFALALEPFLDSFVLLAVHAAERTQWGRKG